MSDTHTGTGADSGYPGSAHDCGLSQPDRNSNSISDRHSYGSLDRYGNAHGHADRDANYSHRHSDGPGERDQHTHGDEHADDYALTDLNEHADDYALANLNEHTDDDALADLNEHTDDYAIANDYQHTDDYALTDGNEHGRRKPVSPERA